MIWRLLLSIFVSQCLVSAENNDLGNCNSNGVCLPGAEDIAVDPRTVTASNTCGNPPARYCQKGPPRSCSTCDSSSNTTRHPPKFMIDRSHDQSNANLTTWWQSQTWWQWYQIDTVNPLTTNVTLSFNKTYIITGEIRVTFRSPKPSQIIMEKSADFGRTWTPLQYFAKQCSALNMSSSLSNCSRDGVLCTEKYSDPSPGSLYFSFLDCYTQTNFWEMQTQKLFNATDLRLQLKYPGTDGQELKNSKETLNRYFYAISDIQVYGRCQCNGHAPNCDFKYLNGHYINTPKCMCRHNTEGVDCQKCEPQFNNKTWMPATSPKEPNQCEECECHEHASSCTFNDTLGHGICDDCKDNTTGYFCENCQYKFYRNLSKHLNDSEVCLDCDCVLAGVTNNGSCSQDTATIGQCMCKDNVTDRRCDRCNDTYYGYALSPVGTCLECLCDKFGTVNGSLNCHNDTTGQCTCKSNLHLRTCSECKVGFYNFPNSTAADCLECHCDSGGSTKEICEKIRGKCLCRNGVQGEICSNVTDNRFFPNFNYFLFEAEYQSGNFTLKNDLSGYERYFTGTGYARITEKLYVDFAISVDIQSNYSLALRYSLAFGNVSIQLRGDAASLNCSVLNQSISTSDLLSHGRGLSWISSETFMLCSHNNYTIRIQTLDAGKNFSIDIDSLVLFPHLTDLRAYKDSSNLVDTCLKNYSTIRGGDTSSLKCRSVTFSTMVEFFNGSLECKCSEIGAINPSTCDPYGGQCHCKRGVMGRMCDRCQPGYYNFTVNGCTPCACDDLGSKNLSVCNPSSGQCQCKRDVVGRTCDRCELNFFGVSSGNGCKPCKCNTTGSRNATCDDVTGKCFCQPGVEDEQTDKCDRCKTNYFNFTEAGCRPCNCNKAGSRSLQCHSSNGECRCKLNTNGKKCGQCINETFALEETNPSGCTPCFCFNRTRQCTSAQGFVLTSTVQSNLTFSPEGFSRLPARFNGNQLRSYGRLFEVDMLSAGNLTANFEFELHVKSSRHYASFRLGNTQCRTLKNGVQCTFLHENSTVERLNAYDMQSILVNIEEVSLNITHQTVNGSFNSVAVNVSMGSAMHGDERGNERANHVESCSCPKSYTTLSCKNCASGFTRDIASTNGFIGCSPCSCNNRSKTCDPDTRVCSNCELSVGDFCEKCDYGVDNATECTTCLPEFWSSNIYKRGCQACDCVLNNTIHHNSSVCNVTSGQCSCKTYVGGQQCERCDDNYYNSSHGCRECPECYGLIQSHIRILRSGIRQLDSIVETLSDRFQAIGRPKFAHRLNVAKSNVSIIFEKANFTANQDTGDLNSTLSGLDYLFSRIKELSDKVNEQMTQQQKLQTDISSTNKWVEAAYFLLKNASLLKPLVGNLTEMIEHFILPIKIRKEMLSQLSKIQSDISLNLSNNSQTWLGKTDSTLFSAKTSRTDLVNSTETLHVMRNKTEVVFDRARNTKILSTNFSKSAENLLATSKGILENVRKLAEQTEVNRNLSGTFEIHDRTAMSYSALEQNVSNAVKKAEPEVNLASQYLNSTSSLVTDAKSVQLEAIRANQSAETTLNDARNTLETLRQFQNRSEKAKQEAKDSLREVSTTEGSSQRSIKHTRNVSDSINDALISTNDAVRLAKKAHSLSREEKQNITSVYNRSKILQETVTPRGCSHDLMKSYRENITSRSQDVKHILSSCPRHNATNNSRLAAAALSESEKTERYTADLRQDLTHVQVEVSKTRNATETLKNDKITKEQQNKIQTHKELFQGLREALKQLRVAKEEKTTYIQDLKVRIRTLKLEVQSLESLRDSLNGMPPCGPS